MTVKMEDGRGVIRLGDKTDHGGEVVQVAHDVTDMGKPIACKGDMVKCPKCKGTFPIVEGEATWTIDGAPVAFHGHKTACGAMLLSSWGSSAGGGASGGREVVTTISEIIAESKVCHDDRYIIRDERGQPMPSTYYAAKFTDGKIEYGTTDDKGNTHICLTGYEAKEIKFYIAG